MNSTYIGSTIISGVSIIIIIYYGILYGQLYQKHGKIKSQRDQIVERQTKNSDVSLNNFDQIGNVPKIETPRITLVGSFDHPEPLALDMEKYRERLLKKEKEEKFWEENEKRKIKLEQKIAEEKRQKKLKMEANGQFEIDPNEVQIFVLTRREAFATRDNIRQFWKKDFDNVSFMVGEYCPIPDHMKVQTSCELDDEKVKKSNDYRKECQKDPDFHHKYGNMTLKQKLDKLEEFYALKIHHPYHKDIDQKIREKESDDTVILPLVDTYRNLTKKVFESYKYLLKKHPTANWFAKVDDDQFCRPDELAKVVSNVAGGNSGYDDVDPINHAVIMGKIKRWSPVVRRTWSKWFEPWDSFPTEKPEHKEDGSQFYPAFPVGSAGHVINRKYAEYLVENMDTLKCCQGEDVSIGYWLEKGPLKPLSRILDKPGRFQNNGKCEQKDLVIVGHRLKKDDLRKCSEY